MDDRGSLDRLKSILDLASSLPTDARGELLDRECGTDAKLRSEIERLLGLHDAAGSFLPSGPAPPEPNRPPAPTTIEGRKIGPYVLVEKIGEGGFGTVYLAQQQHPIQRRVALKLVRAGVSSAQVLARFEAERQVLAVMDHPNIAVVYDAGVTDEGDPYFVMEHVAGPPITTYADDRRLGIEERLRLFQQLCEAIQHAHQKGVIHRDLKPSNVLVAHVGEKFHVKVIDFGVAKALGPQFSQETLHTLAGMVIGTPEYMSPEQASPSPLGVDTRTDVYSLGVILFELLAGGLPFERSDTPGEDLLGLLQRIRDKEPPRLTTRLDSRGAAAQEIAQQRRTDRQSLVRRLRGDLEAIVLKALEKDPERRYSSAATLAEDVGRHLANLPILARTPSTAYQIQKLVARHKGMAALGATLVVALVFFAISMSIMYSRQSVERRKAEHINDFLQEMLSASDPRSARGDEVLARDILDRAAERVSKELVDEPKVQVAVLGTLTEAYSRLGLPSEALALARSSVPIAERAYGRKSIEGAAAIRSFGECLREAGHPDSAVSVLEESATILNAKRKSHPLEVARSLNALAVTRWELGQHVESEKLYREALPLVEVSAGHDNPEYATVLNGLAQSLSEQGRFAEAEAPQREALAIHQAASGLDHPDVLTNMNNLALLLRKERKYAEAESLYRATITLERKVLGDSHPILAMGLNNLAVLVKSLGRVDEAESLQVESLAIRRRVLGNEHPAVASSLNNLAAIYVQQDRTAEAEQFYREALAIRVKLYGDDHADVATVRHNLAALYWSQSKLAEAEQMERRALDARSKSLAPAHDGVVASSQLLAQILLARKRPAEAQTLIEKCLAAQTSATDVDDVLVAWSRILLGQSRLAQGSAAEAETLLVTSLDPLLEDATIGHMRKRSALLATIEASKALGKGAEASRFQAKLDSLSTK